MRSRGLPRDRNAKHVGPHRDLARMERSDSSVREACVSAEAGWPKATAVTGKRAHGVRDAGFAFRPVR